MLNFASRVIQPSGVLVLVTRAPLQSPVCALKKDNITIKSVAIFTDIRMISVVDMTTVELIIKYLFSFFNLALYLTMFYPCQSYHTYVKSTNAKGTNDALLKNKDSNKKIIFLTLKRIEEGIV